MFNHAHKLETLSEEVARVAACLASESFSFATGNTIIVDGGKVII
jgi:3-oxoacyl-[acyl-carrier protein] reductase